MILITEIELSLLRVNLSFISQSTFSCDLAFVMLRERSSNPRNERMIFIIQQPQELLS